MAQSGLLDAIRAYRTGLTSNSGLLAAQGRLAQACAEYIQVAGSFDSDTRRIVERLHLTELQSEQFWRGITDGSARQERQRLLVAAYSKVLFASSHLPSLMDMLRLAGDDSPPAGLANLRLVVLDANEPAASPDRIARVIDGIDLVYRACAAIVARKNNEPLQLQSIGGRASRSIEFRGDARLVVAARHVLVAAQQATRHINAVENELEGQIAAIAPIAVLDKLAALGRHTEAAIEQIRESLIAGSTMLVQAGAQPGPDDTELTSDATTMSGDGFRNIDDLVNAELDQHSLDLVAAERARMLEQAESGELATPDVRTTAGRPVGNAMDERIDELIVDLNRFYSPGANR